MMQSQAPSISKKSRIPEFKTYEEEAKFWDTHSVTDFEDETEDVDIVVELSKPRDETFIAKKGINVSALARIWFSEKLQQAT